MKRLSLIAFSLTLSLSLASCQDKSELSPEIQSVVDAAKEGTHVSYEDIMELSNNLSPHPQGGDCWGNYFFQFVTNNSCFRVYDLLNKELVATISIPRTEHGFVSNCHCNTASFGAKYYDVEDEFPLLYVSTGYASGGYTGALVYRIVRHVDAFFITLVQTIRFPVLEGSSWTEFVPDNEYSYLCYTSERVIFKVKTPDISEGDVIIDRSQAIETYQFSPQPDWMSTSRNQDRIFYRGKIAFVSGVPQSGEASAFVLLNLETKEREKIIDFKKMGLKSESESIFLWNGDLCVAFVDRIIKLNLE